MVCYKQFRLRDRVDNLHAHILSAISHVHACHFTLLLLHLYQ